jgi:hypothetical protein
VEIRAINFLDDSNPKLGVMLILILQTDELQIGIAGMSIKRIFFSN